MKKHLAFGRGFDITRRGTSIATGTLRDRIYLLLSPQVALKADGLLFFSREDSISRAHLFLRILQFLVDRLPFLQMI